MDSSILFNPLVRSSRTNLNITPSNNDSYHMHECKTHAKKKIFMFCMNHDSGICCDCWNSPDDDFICSQFKKNCNLQPIEYYLR